MKLIPIVVILKDKILCRNRCFFNEQKVGLFQTESRQLCHVGQKWTCHIVSNTYSSCSYCQVLTFIKSFDPSRKLCCSEAQRQSANHMDVEPGCRQKCYFIFVVVFLFFFVYVNHCWLLLVVHHLSFFVCCQLLFVALCCFIFCYWLLVGLQGSVVEDIAFKQ